ncbi:class I SAM-dependent methyltransferase [Streptomyces prunicolor]|uniref:class I SAM-dependent methyltransferase n=1 Tax=Streptomyces prunicolor TaxID=67348 RepID=UPI002253958C|nr:class I SAM-dependent methyltransferase [Streptomyces prunicolor]MCX5239888.1 class I SAM-dependent methyltransferase [Streptomyces prunicolor]
MPDNVSALAYDTAWYKQYQALSGVDGSKKQLEAAALMHALSSYEVRAPGSVLDIGTATARYLLIFGNLGWKATGVDRSAAALLVAQQEIHDANLSHSATLIHNDIRNVELHNQRFDLITCMMGTFAHLPENDRLTVLKGLHSHTSVGGVLAVSTWNPDWPTPTVLSLYGEFDREKIIENSPKPQQLTELFLQAGFENVELRNVCPFTDDQIDQWLPWHERSPHLIQQYVLDHDIVLQGQLALVTGQKSIRNSKNHT